MSTEQTLQGLQARIAKAQNAQARAQVEYENATKEYEAAMAALAEHGVSTAEEARALLTRLEADLAQELAQVEAALTEAGA